MYLRKGYNIFVHREISNLQQNPNKRGLMHLQKERRYARKYQENHTKWNCGQSLNIVKKCRMRSSQF